MSVQYLDSTEVARRVEDLKRNRLEQRRDDIRSLMRKPHGRRIAYWLIFELGRLESPCFPHAIKDGHGASLHQAYNEGVRSMAISILSKLQEDAPDDYLNMMGEEIRSRQSDLSLQSHTPRSVKAKT